MFTPTKIKVRFRDCDMLGHVNNAVYLSYFEQARMDYFNQMLGKKWDYSTHGLILVKNEITYLKAIHLDGEVEISLHLVHIGNKSFTFGYKVMVNNTLCTTGKSTLVCYDFKKKKSVPIYPDFREAMEKLDKE
ncbi:MAG: thioesterase family protein [Brumimicrobium sp.]